MRYELMYAKIGCSDKSFLERHKEEIEKRTNTIIQIVDLNESIKRKLINREVSIKFGDD
jgi:hypothetical protein